MSEPIEPAPLPLAEPLVPTRPNRWPLVAAVTLTLAALVLGFGAYRVWLGRARRGLIARVEKSDKPRSRAEIARSARRFRGDRELLGASLLLAGDAKASDAAHWNALLLETAVVPHPGGPATIGQLEWKDGAVSG